MEFEGTRYKPSASDADRDLELRKINERTRAITTGGVLSDLDEAGLKNELNARRQVFNELRADPDLSNPATKAAERKRIAERIFGENYDPAAIRMMTGTSNEDLMTQMTDVHRVRALKAHYQGTPLAASQVRHGLPARPGAELITTAGQRRALEDRLTVLMRHRQGRDIFAGLTPEQEEADRHIDDVQNLIGMLTEGQPVTQLDVENALESSQASADSAPVDTSGLPAAQRNLYQTQPNLFDVDPATGRVTIKPHGQR
jgi:hypothetical protein